MSSSTKQRNKYVAIERVNNPLRKWPYLYLVYSTHCGVTKQPPVNTEILMNTAMYIESIEKML